MNKCILIHSKKKCYTYLILKMKQVLTFLFLLNIHIRLVQEMCCFFLHIYHAFHMNKKLRKMSDKESYDLNKNNHTFFNFPEY